MRERERERGVPYWDPYYNGSRLLGAWGTILGAYVVGSPSLEVISTGRQWLILAFTVGRMLLAIGMIAHIMACIWYGLGKAGHTKSSRGPYAGVGALDP